MNDSPTRRPGDPILLLEAGLTLLLIGLFLLLYFVPSRQAGFIPDWWVWPILVGLFFGILLLDRWRRKRGPQAGSFNGEGPA